MTRPGFAFRETMVGTLVATKDGGPIDLEVELAVEIRDLDAFLVDPSHSAPMTGEVCSRVLGGSFHVEAGTIQLFPQEGGRHGAEMRYRIDFRDALEAPMRLIGVKTLHRGKIGGVWRDVTVTDSRLVEGSAAGAGMCTTVAVGTIRITPAAVVREMTTVRGRGGSPIVSAASALRFAAFFAGSVFSAYRPRSREPERP